MKRHTSRRDFARTLAAAGVSALVPSSLVLQSATPARPAGQSSQQETQPSPQAEAMLQLLKAKFPDRLDQEQLKRALNNCDGIVRASERMSKAALSNGDEPDFVFSAGRPARRR